MARPVFWSVLGGWLLIGLGAGSVRADAWTDALFTENQHDFGMVPRGVKVKHDFLMVNRLGEPITILNLRPSCGCTSGRASASQVGPGPECGHRGRDGHAQLRRPQVDDSVCDPDHGERARRRSAAGGFVA